MHDLLVIGGGINGTAIARDAAGRGLNVALVEMGDLASATSSGSTKLYHGGLRYLEFYEFRLVREALHEREVLLRAAPHIAHPMRFVLPHHAGLRPAWLLRLGLFLYDALAGRSSLPRTRKLDLRTDPAGAPLRPEFRTAFEYSDGWVDDARLVALTARDAAERGAAILTRTRVEAVETQGDRWVAHTRTAGGEDGTLTARAIVNAAGPWAAELLTGAFGQTVHEDVRLVRGSHIVVPRLFDHDRAYFLQGGDGRIVFAIPYQRDFTLIGTTEVDHPGPDVPAECTDEEAAYLCDFVSEYFAKPVKMSDIVWRYSAVRPLYDDGASSATKATRDYVLRLDAEPLPHLTVFGGKITTHRKLAEAALAKIGPSLGGVRAPWTADAPLPGGDFEMGGVPRLAQDLAARYPFLTPDWAMRLATAYGTDAAAILGEAASAAELGLGFGATLTGAEVDWMMAHEFARTAEDVIWRRSKLGLRMAPDQVAALEDYMKGKRGKAA